MSERAQHIWRFMKYGGSRVWRASLGHRPGLPKSWEKSKDLGFSKSSTPGNVSGGGRGDIWE